MRPSTTLAARNNAGWCDAVCTARGVPGTFSDRLWIGDRPPPYYPNIITLEPSSRSLLGELREAIDGQRSAGRERITVKDSFADVDLSTQGFGVLFEANWFGRPGSSPLASARRLSAQWKTVRNREGLLAWTKAWDPEIVKVDPVFHTRLLNNENVLFVEASQAGQLVAGAIVNQHAGAVGISNFFSRASASETYWAECASIAMARYPGLPLLGYAQGMELSGALRAGSESFGALRVWTAG